MIQLLQGHPARVLEPEPASLFVLPVLPYISFLARDCLGTSHEQRMAQAATALSRSIYFARKGGHDHLVVTNTFRTQTFRALKPLLGNATFGWFEDPKQLRPGPNILYRQAFWRCTIVVPYQANPFCLQQRSVRGAARGAMPRKHSIFFQGSFGAGSKVRVLLRRM